jgi:hypothetical protein
VTDMDATPNEQLDERMAKRKRRNVGYCVVGSASRLAPAVCASRSRIGPRRSTRS